MAHKNNNSWGRTIKQTSSLLGFEMSCVASFVSRFWTLSTQWSKQWMSFEGTRLCVVKEFPMLTMVDC